MKTDQLPWVPHPTMFNQDGSQRRLVPIESVREMESELSAQVSSLRERLADAYIKLSGKDAHASDCATSCAPAEDPHPCDCNSNAEHEPRAVASRALCSCSALQSKGEKT